MRKVYIVFVIGIIGVFLLANARGVGLWQYLFNNQAGFTPKKAPTQSHK